MERVAKVLAVVAVPAAAFPLKNDGVDNDLPWTWFRIDDTNQGKTCAQMSADTKNLVAPGGTAADDDEKYDSLTAPHVYNTALSGSWTKNLMGSVAVADNGCKRGTFTGACDDGYGTNGLYKYHTKDVEEMSETACNQYMKFWTKNSTATLEKKAVSPGASPKCVDQWLQASSVIHWKQYDEVASDGGMYAVCCKKGRAAHCNSFATMCKNTPKSSHRTFNDVERIFSANGDNVCKPHYTTTSATTNKKPSSSPRGATAGAIAVVGAMAAVTIV